MLVLALSLLLHAARASDVAEAEHVRLADDMEQLAGRQLWSAVEKKFSELRALGVPLTYADLLRGAYAARALGDVQAAYERLRSASRIEGTQEVLDGMASIDAHYGRVELITHNARGIELSAEEMPFEPDQRRAIEAALERVRRDGGFVGLLPRGDYRYAGHDFRVEPGIGVRVEVSPRLKKTSGVVVNVSSAPDTTPSELPEDEER